MGGPKGCLLFFLRIFWRLFWSSHNLCSVPSNSVYGPPKIIVLSPQIPFIVPLKSLFCPLLITIHCSPKIIVMSPQIPLILHQISFIVHQKYFLSPLNYKSLVPPKKHCFVPSNSKSLFCLLKSVYGHFKIIVLSPQIPFMGTKHFFDTDV